MPKDPSLQYFYISYPIFITFIIKDRLKLKIKLSSIQNNIQIFCYYYPLQFYYQQNQMSIDWTTPLKIGSLNLKNRIILSAMTRMRANQDQVPTKLMAEYYSQRSGGGLLLTESTSWSPNGRGFNGSPCIYNDLQAEGWKDVVASVHAKGAFIFLQIFHAGRSTHQSKIDNLQVQAPSAIQNKTLQKHQSYTNFPVPKEMTIEDIEYTKKQFEDAVIRAKLAGFDGIELHGANGFLIDNFLRSCSNKRTDKYGGSAQNRVRFALQLADIALKHFDSYRIGIKITPGSKFNDMSDQNPVETYSTLIKGLEERKIGFVQIEQSNDPTSPLPDIAKVLRPFFSGVIINNSGFTPQTGINRIKSGIADAISFGNLYINNPDLPERIINGLPLSETPVNWAFAYGDKIPLQNKHKGYTDYPFYQKSNL